MITVRQWRTTARTIATTMIFIQGMYYANTQPGMMDTYNGAMAGIVVFCIWFGRNKDE
jgi:hypothetical protein